MNVSTNPTADQITGALSAADVAREYHAWRLPVRAFHWINLVALLWLIGSGLCILFENELSLPTASRVSLKTVHKWAGYVFVINLLVRIAWGFVDRGHGNLRRVLPFRRGFWGELRGYIAGGQATPYVGLNPVGSLMVFALLVLLLAQGATGLVLAGTDLYQGPFGDYFARWIAAPGVDIATLVPGDRTSPKISKDGMASMRAFRAPIVATHLYVFYAILLFAFLHIAGVVWAECAKRVNVVSAMITGRKRLSGTPVDAG